MHRYLLVSILTLGCASGVSGTNGVQLPSEGDSGTPSMDADTPPPAMDGGTLMPVDAGQVESDSGVNMRIDSGPPPDCESDEDCSDDLACNGAERCVEGTCEAGTRVTCNDDGISCTVEACVEPSGTCESTPMDALCPMGQTCMPGEGCGGGTPECMDDVCDLVPQCGCEDDEGCYVGGGGTRICSSAGTKEPGEACSGAVTDCVPGSLCVNHGTTAAPQNQCARVCRDDADCPGAGSLCLLDLGNGIRACTPDCDPVAQTGCATGLACRITRESDGDQRFFTTCDVAGRGLQDDICDVNADCAAGNICIDYGFWSYCEHYCDRPGFTGTTAGCAPGVPCAGVTLGGDPLQIGTVTYGTCG